MKVEMCTGNLKFSAYPAMKVDRHISSKVEWWHKKTPPNSYSLEPLSWVDPIWTGGVIMGRLTRFYKLL